MKTFNKELYIQKIIDATKECNTDYIGPVKDIVKSTDKIILKCRIHNITWKTTSACAFISSKTECRECNKEKVRKAQFINTETYIQRFRDTDAYSQDTVFIRIGDSKWWDFICPVCSKDKYCKAGLCRGVFRTQTRTLSIGQYPCRCGNTFLTEDQILFNLQDILKDTKYTFIRKDQEGSLRKVNIVLDCPDHGEFKVQYHDFKNRDRVCPSCGRSRFKYEERAFLYILKIEGFHDSFTGYGITGDLKGRFYKHNKILEGLGYKITDMKIFEAAGKFVYDVELQLKRTFQKHHMNVEGFVRESTSIENHKTLLHYCESKFST